MKALARVATLVLAATSASAAAAEVHVVKPGESLSTIAQQRLGDLSLWPRLYEANRDRIKDPTRIYPGQELTIPAPEPAPEAPAEEGAGEDE